MVRKTWNPDTSHIPEDAVYWKEKPTVQRAMIKTDNLLKNPPQMLVKWLEHMGIDEVPERTKMRQSISRNLKRRDIYKPAMDWRVKACREMKSWKLKMLTPQVAREIAWRLVELMSFDLQPDAVLKKGSIVEEPTEESEIEGMEFLPKWMRWAVLHPGLTYSDEDVQASDHLADACARYVEKYPCPDQGAMNKFLAYRGDRSKLHKLFEEIGRLHFQNLKNSGSDTADDQVKSEEEKSIETLESILKGS